jgi:hypothetical protein
VDDLKKLVADLLEITSRNNIEASGLTTYEKHETRIFEQGKNASGNKIGDYSTKGITIESKNSPQKFKGKDKDGNPTVSKYFPGGYRQFRQTIGRESSFVNLELFGDMRKSYIPGWQDERYAIGFLTKAEADKAVKNEIRFKKGPIFELTESEIDYFVDNLMLPLE